MYLFCCRGQFSHSPGKINQDKITPRRPACVYWALMWVKNTPQKQWVSADFYPDCMWPWLTATAWLHLLRSLCCYISNISECSLYILYLLLEPTCQPQPISLVIHTSDDLPFLCTISKTCCFNKISIFFFIPLLYPYRTNLSPNTLSFHITKSLFLQRFPRPRMSPLLTFLLLYYVSL